MISHVGGELNHTLVYHVVAQHVTCEQKSQNLSQRGGS